MNRSEAVDYFSDAYVLTPPLEADVCVRRGTDPGTLQDLGFREMVDVCGLPDLGYEGYSWTFEKRVAGGSYCRVQLESALAMTDWSTRFPTAQQLRRFRHCFILG
jgi:hypothetical protein